MVGVAPHHTDGLLLGSSKVTISAFSAFSAGTTPAVSSFAGVPPRMILTACHPVSGNETICTLTGFFSGMRLFSGICLPVITVVWCFGLTEPFAAYPGCCIDSSAINAPETTPAQKPFRIDPPTDAIESDTLYR